MTIFSDPQFIEPGMVALVGAGPGDPNLLTLGALKALNIADVVVYDALVSEEILAMIPHHCQRLFAGKRGGRPSTSQDDILATLITLAKEGKRVVRLKGGDPFVFGRGGEEALQLVQAGVPFRVCPGLTVGIAGPAYAGIPVTHRDINSSLALITGHESGDREPHLARIDWEMMGKTMPVMVLYMAVKNLPSTAQRMMAGGWPQTTPVAIIRWATTVRQTTLITTLELLQQTVVQQHILPPSIIIIGDVVNLRQQLRWFPDKETVIDL